MYKPGATQEVSMREFVVLLVLATVFLAGLFVFAPVCSCGGDPWTTPFHQGLEKRHWEGAEIIGFGVVMDGVTEYLPFIQERNWPWHMTDYGHGPGMRGYWFGGFFMWIVFIVIIALVVYLIIRAKRPQDEDALMSETPLHILKKRYARGEISKEEFDEIRKDIET